MEPDGDLGDQVGLPRALSRDAGVEAHSGERDAEQAGVDRRREARGELVLLADHGPHAGHGVGGAQHVDLEQGDLELELADQAERARAEHELAAQAQREVAVGGDPAVRLHAGQPEEVDRCADRDHPVADAERDLVVLDPGVRVVDEHVAAADLEQERCLERDDLEDRELAGQRDLQRLPPDRHAPRVAVGVGRVEAELAGGLDLDDVEDRRVDRDGQSQDDAGVRLARAAVDAGEALGVDGDRAERDGELEEQLEVAVLVADQDGAARADEAAQRHRAVDQQLEARRDVVAAVDRLLRDGARVELEQRGGR